MVESYEKNQASRGDPFRRRRGCQASRGLREKIKEREEELGWLSRQSQAVVCRVFRGGFVARRVENGVTREARRRVPGGRKGRVDPKQTVDPRRQIVPSSKITQRQPRLTSQRFAYREPPGQEGGTERKNTSKTRTV